MSHIDMGHGAAAPSPADGSEKVQFVTFALDGQRYCIDIMTVREIRISSAITALPGAPDYVKGVMNLRGTIVPVCDLKARFGLRAQPASPSGAIVIAAINGKLTGLLVDEVCDILAVPAGAVAPVPDAAPGRASAYFAGIVTEGHEMMIVLAPDRLMGASGNDPMALSAL